MRPSTGSRVGSETQHVQQDRAVIVRRFPGRDQQRHHRLVCQAPFQLVGGPGRVQLGPVALGELGEPFVLMPEPGA